MYSLKLTRLLNLATDTKSTDLSSSSTSAGRPSNTGTRRCVYLEPLL